MPKRKKPRGRPPIKQFPSPIDATPEVIAEVVLRAKPPKEWDYLKNEDARVLDRDSSAK